MQKNSFIEILDDFSKAQNYKNELKTLTDAFPFDMSSKILLAKNEANSQSMFADKKLRLAALFAPNRAYLKKIFTQNQVEVFPQLIEQSSVVFTESEIIENDTVEKIIIDEVFENPQNQLVEDELLENIAIDSIVKQEEFVPKIYIHNSTFGNTPKLSSSDLVKDFLSYRGVLDVQNVSAEIQQQIIQKFLEEEPTINRLHPDNETSNKEDLSKKSTISSELVTENYANILIKQNKFAKAIEIYQKLILKYPEKESYFVEKIAVLNSYNNK